MRYLLTALLALPLVAQTSINLGPIVVPDDVAASINAWRKDQVTVTRETSAAVNNSVTKIPLKATPGIDVGTHIVIDNEEMAVASVTDKDMTVTRGVVGTAAAPHVAGQTVKVLRFSTNIEALRQFIRDGVRTILQSNPSASILAQKAASAEVISAEQAKIDAAEKAAVQ